MNQDSIILRSANPTFDEGLVFAYYLDEAFEGLFRLMLGKRAADIVATAYTKPNHDFSYQNTIFAVCDKTIVGMATGYTTEQHRLQTRHARRCSPGGEVKKMRYRKGAMYIAPLR